MIRIALTDDHPMMLAGLRHILTGYPHIMVTGTYGNGDELLRGMERSLPDVLLLDIQMPGKNGDELIPVILKRYPGLRILILSNFDSVLYANNTMGQGASGYLLKTAEASMLVEAIDSIHRGGKFIQPSIEEKMERIDYKLRKATSGKSSLTPRELDILQLLANGDTSAEIGRKLFLSTGTVENYRSTILLKLDVKNNVALVRKALQIGLIE